MSIELKGNDESSFSDDVAIAGDIQAGGDPGSGVVGAKIGSAGYLFGCRSGTAVIFAGHDEGDANATSIIRADGSIDAAGLLTTQGSINSNRTTGTSSVFIGLLNDVTTSRINANGAASFRDLESYNPTTSSSGDLYRGYSDVNGTNSLQFSVTSAGLVQARTGTINVIGSERRIKEEINPVDAAVSWETIKNTPYYSYRFIGSDFISYGPIVDEVPSEMVMEGMTSDETGNIRTYDNGMLQARLYTALQTALTRIEALEAKVTSLEGGTNS